MQSFLKDFIEDESGLTAVEYAIAGGLVVGGMVAAFLTLGENATTQIETLGCAVDGTAIVDDETGIASCPAAPE